MPDATASNPVSDRFRELEPVPSPMSTAEWAAVEPAVRNGAFFSAGVEDAHLLEALRQNMDRAIAEGWTQQEFIAAMNQWLREHVDPATGRPYIDEEAREDMTPEEREAHERKITNIDSVARLKLIFRTQAELASGWAQFRHDMSPERLRKYPAWEFYRKPGAKTFRKDHVKHQGEIRLKTDFDYWMARNSKDQGGFQNPFPPFGFNSWMWVLEVDRDECEDLGLLKPGEPAPQVDARYAPWLPGAGGKQGEPGKAAPSAPAAPPEPAVEPKEPEPEPEPEKPGENPRPAEPGRKTPPSPSTPQPAPATPPAPQPSTPSTPATPATPSTPGTTPAPAPGLYPPDEVPEIPPRPSWTVPDDILNPPRSTRGWGQRAIDWLRVWLKRRGMVAVREDDGKTFLVYSYGQNNRKGIGYGQGNGQGRDSADRRGGGGGDTTGPQRSVQRGRDTGAHPDGGGAEEVPGKLGRGDALQQEPGGVSPQGSGGGPKEGLNIVDVRRALNDAAARDGLGNADEFSIVASAQLQAVAEGRKGAFLESWENGMRSLRAVSPPGVLYVEAGGQQCFFTVDSVRMATGARLSASAVPGYVRGLLEKGDTGRLLGYGRNEFAQPPGLRVDILRNGEPVAGFTGFPTEVETIPYARARVEDFRRAFPDDVWGFKIEKRP